MINSQGNQYAYFHEEDESTFHTVNTVKEQKSNYIRQRNRFAANRTRRDKVLQKQQQQIEQQTRLGLTKKQKYINRERQQDMRRINKQFGRLNTNTWNNDYRRQNRVHREASVQVKDTWKVVEEIEFSRFSKLALTMTETPVDLMLCGDMAYYDKNFDRVSTRNTQKLKLMNRLIHNVSTGDDPIIRKLAAQNAGNVFATDSLISCLMCCSRSVESWDITAQRVGDMLFLDKRPGNTNFDFVTVNETAVEPPPEDANNINSASSLSLEATFINHNFVQQVLHADRVYSFPNGNPFVDDEDDDDKGNLGSVGYRYRRFDLGNDIRLVCRCEHDAVVENRTTGADGSSVSETEAAAAPLFVTVRALNEWDSRISGGIDWRAKLDVQRGAVLGAEIKNNAFKLAKWTVGALLAGSDQLKLGYVTREAAKGNNAHVVLGTQQFKPAEFATQINLKMENAWGVLRSIIDLCMKLEQGLYLIMKDPNKQILRIYDVPNDAFEDDADANSDEEEDEAD